MCEQPARAHPVEEDTVWGVAYRIAEDKEKEVWDYLGEPSRPGSSRNMF